MINNGNDLRVRISGQSLSAEGSSNISFNNSLLDVTQSVTGTYSESVTGIKSANINFERLVSFDLTLNVGDTVDFHYGPARAGWEGTAIVETIEVTSPVDEVINMSGSLKSRW